MIPTTAKSPRVALYARVSRGDQNPALQIDEMKMLAERRGWDVYGMYVDQGFSGTKDRRPELDRLLKDVRRGHIDILCVWRSDRLFRSLKHMVTTVEELAALGVCFTSVTEPFDGTTPSGKLLLHVISAMAEFERAILVERVCAGLDAARRRGTRIGRPHVRIDLERAHDLRRAGRSFRAIALTLGIGETTVRRALSTDTTQYAAE
jgi:DNA invertase Pin-like site-specific DNA recombinase